MSSPRLDPVPTLTRLPVSSYRLQLNQSFTFDHARAVVPYLSELGATELYASPVLQARPGSTHGYDVCDPTRLSVDLGGEDAWSALSEAVRHDDIGVILDIVPNHMAAAPRFNPWWRDVLTRGTASPHAAWFDIDWHQSGLEGRVLVPILGGTLEDVVARGELRLVFEEGAYWFAYFDERIPVDPTRAGLDGRDPQRLLAEANRPPDGREATSVLTKLLESAPAQLAYWARAAHRLNYRRFFDVTELVCVRVERPEVFAATHQRVLDLVREGTVTGLRVDHPDGLWDPTAYVQRLQGEARGTGLTPVYLLVEKILSPGERLPQAWKPAVHGTTGYNFLSVVNGLWVDPRAEAALTATWTRLTGRSEEFDEILITSKLDVLDSSLAGELSRLAERLASLTTWSEETARRVLRLLVTAFPVYRTYVTTQGTTAVDREVIERAVGEASRRAPGDRARLAELGRLLTLDGAGVSDTEPDADLLEFIMRFQQLTGPAQAKGLEDTAGYRYARLLSLNEVGAMPAVFGSSATRFHESNADRRASWPLEMLATTTHDTKRGEDARVRLSALSEMPDAWDEAVTSWFATHAALRRTVDGRPAPSPVDEYLYYQTLIGVWPPETDSAPCPERADPELVERVVLYMSKAIREAKERTSWLAPNPSYEAAVEAFVRTTLAGAAAPTFLKGFIPFQRRVARLGLVNSLAQLALKLAAPGVPDIYQGAELWDFSLVDPDNRRPVDFKHRREQLEWLRSHGLGPVAAETIDRRVRDDAMRTMLARAWDGTIKLFVTARGLTCRRTQRDLWLWGDYRPLTAIGARATHVVAFARYRNESVLVAAVPRFSGRLTRHDQPFPLGESTWGDTVVTVPAVPRIRAYRHLLTGEEIPVSHGGDGVRVSAAAMFKTFPVAWLWGSAS